jgi:thymidylate synthase (FAD)
MITIIKPSAQIVELTNNVLKDIEHVGRICYKSEDKTTEDSHLKFVQNMMNRSHYSPLEFGIVSFAFSDTIAFINIDKEMQYAKYIHKRYTDHGVVITGSVRAFYEFMPGYTDPFNLGSVLGQELPEFFKPRACVPGYWQRCYDHKVTLVKFTVSRAISHELVRHRVMSWMQESQRYCRYDECLPVVQPHWADEQVDSGIFGSWKQHMEDSHNAYKFALRNLSPQDARGVLPNDTKTELYCLGTDEQWKDMFRLRCSPAAHPEMRRVMCPLSDDFKATWRIV